MGLSDPLSYKIVYNFYFYGATVLVPVAVFFNFLTIFIFLGKKFKKTNFGFLSAILTAFNTFSLIWNLIVYKFFEIIGQDLASKSNDLCFFMQFLSRSIQQLPAFVQVLISLYQYFEIKLSAGKSLAFIHKRKYILLILVLTTVLVFIINVPNLFKYLEIKHATNTTKERKSCRRRRDLTLVADIETALMRTIIPFLLLSILNVLIAKIIINSKKKFSKQNNFKKEYQYALSLFLMNLIFLICTLPLTITYISLTIFENIILNPFLYDEFDLIHSFSNWISYFYFAITFPIDLIFNKTFRKTFFEILNYVFWCRKK